MNKRQIQINKIIRNISAFVAMIFGLAFYLSFLGGIVSLVWTNWFALKLSVSVFVVSLGLSLLGFFYYNEAKKELDRMVKESTEQMQKIKEAAEASKKDTKAKK